MVIITLQHVSSQAPKRIDSNVTTFLVQTCELSFWFLDQRQRVVDLVFDTFFSYANVEKTTPYTPEN